MNRKTKHILSWILKLAVVGGSIYYLVDKLESETWGRIQVLFDREDFISWRTFFLLLLIIDLNSICWLLEAMRWRHVAKPWFKMRMSHALRTVLGSLSFSILTPNHTGNYIVRSFFLPDHVKKYGPAFMFICSVTFIVVVAVAGLAFGGKYILGDVIAWPWYANYLSIGITLFGVFYILRINWFFRQARRIPRLKDWVPDLDLHVDIGFTGKLLGLTLLRYIIMCTDEVLLVYMLMGEVEWIETFTVVMAYYFVVSFIPHFVFAAILVRGAIGVWLLGLIGIPEEVALGVISLSWLLGVALHAIIGIPFFLQIKPEMKRKKAEAEDSSLLKES